MSISTQLNEDGDDKRSRLVELSIATPDPPQRTYLSNSLFFASSLKGAGANEKPDRGDRIEETSLFAYASFACDSPSLRFPRGPRSMALLRFGAAIVLFSEKDPLFYTWTHMGLEPSGPRPAHPLTWTVQALEPNGPQRVLNKGPPSLASRGTLGRNVAENRNAPRGAISLTP